MKAIVFCLGLMLAFVLGAFGAWAVAKTLDGIENTRPVY